VTRWLSALCRGAGRSGCRGARVEGPRTAVPSTKFRP
jgi:hypothetical protein